MQLKIGANSSSEPGQEADAGTDRVSAEPSVEAAAAPSHDSQALLQGGSVAWIEHGRERYLLRLTRQGKLILTK